MGGVLVIGGLFTILNKVNTGDICRSSSRGGGLRPNMRKAHKDKGHQPTNARRENALRPSPVTYADPGR